MTGRPVLADSARENVLLPAPAVPVTTTRRPTDDPGGMSITDRSTGKPSSGTRAFCRTRVHEDASRLSAVLRQYTGSRECSLLPVQLSLGHADGPTVRLGLGPASLLT